MAKVSRQELDEFLTEEDEIQDDVFGYEEFTAYEKQVDFNVVEEAVETLPEGVTVHHDWLED